MLNHVYTLTKNDMNELHFVEMVKLIKKFESKCSKILDTYRDGFIDYQSYKNKLSKFSKTSNSVDETYIASSWLDAFYTKYLEAKEESILLSSKLHTFDYDNLLMDVPSISVYGSRFILRKNSDFNTEMKLLSSDSIRMGIKIVEKESSDVVLDVYVLDNIDKDVSNLAVVVNPAFGISMNNVYIKDRLINYTELKFRTVIPLEGNGIDMKKYNYNVISNIDKTTKNAYKKFITFLTLQDLRYIFFINNTKIHAFVPETMGSDYVEDRFIKIHNTRFVTDIVYAYADMLGIKVYEIRKNLMYVNGMCSRCNTFNHQITNKDTVFKCTSCGLLVPKEINITMNLLTKFKYINTDDIRAKRKYDEVRALGATGEEEDDFLDMDSGMNLFM